MSKRHCVIRGRAAVWMMLLLGMAVRGLGAATGDPLAEAKSHFARYGTNRVHYFIVGRSKPTVLFVHGWASRGSFWREQIPALADKAQLLLIDLPGHGQSDKPRTEYTMDFFAGAVLAVLAEAKVDQATLVGHSMGAPVICRVYQQAPAKVAALVAVDGMLRRPALKPEQVEPFVGPYRTAQYREQAKRFITSMFPNAGTEALRDRVIADMLQTPQYVMAGAMDGMFAAGQPAWDLQKVKVPVLVINAQNPIWNAEYEAYVRGVSSQVEYRTIDKVGHFIMLEKPAEFNRALLELLQKHKLIGQ